MIKEIKKMLSRFGAAFVVMTAMTIVAPLAMPITVRAQVQQADADMNIIPDKSIKTDNGIRISVCLIGIPSTSNRIDAVDLVVGNNVYKATDIDGIDFERYFQFEDMGVVTVDIDFPFKGQLPKNAQLIFHTIKGDILSPARQ